MICNNCGAQLNDNTMFCPKCGIQLSTSQYNYQSSSGNYTAKASNSNNLLAVLIAVVSILIIIIGAVIFYMYTKEPQLVGGGSSAVSQTNNQNANSSVTQQTPLPQTPAPVQYMPPVFTRVEASSTRGVDWTAGVPNYYYPSYAIDGDMNTAWAANRNYGTTPSLTLYADSKQHVTGIRMANGYFKSPQTYTRNRRITCARIEYEGGSKTQYFGIDQYRVMQDVRFDAPADTSYIRIQVLETYYGDWKDINISEVEVY